jgi:hypothetical protein
MMLDDLRNDADFIGEDDDQLANQNKRASASAGAQTGFLGMTAQQRFVIAVMILLMVCILGSFFLLITGSVALPV